MCVKAISWASKTSSLDPRTFQCSDLRLLDLDCSEPGIKADVSDSLKCRTITVKLAYPDMPYYTKSLKSTTYLKHSSPQIKQWLKRCNESHENCRAVRNESTFLPSRLIEITAVCKNRRLCASFTEIIGFWPRTHLK
jgi:hypothetical protein